VCKIFKNQRRFKIVGAAMVTRGKIHTEAPQIIRVTLQNLVSTATWHSKFVHRCLHTGCFRRCVPYFGRTLFELNYVGIDTIKNSYIRHLTFKKTRVREILKYWRCYALIDY